jgi:D-hexose-6-phosphate mutarotase
MDRTTLDALQRRFGIDGAVKFLQEHEGLPSVEIHNRFCSSRIALQGAQMLHWTPAGQEPVVWLSPKAKFLAGKSARGGIPVCWPWFGPHASESSFPAHGFARGTMWDVVEVEALDNGAHRLVFRLVRTDDDARQWPYAASLEIRFTLGLSLEIELVTRNVDKSSFKLAEALHTYFTVGDVSMVRVTGLDGTSYLDRVGTPQMKQQTGPVTIAGEVDRLYTGTGSTCVIEDPSLKRRIRIEKRGSLSTVVWNPGDKKAAAMGDFEDNGYLRMLCVESANAGGDAVSIKPGETHTMWVKYSVEAGN